MNSNEVKQYLNSIYGQHNYIYHMNELVKWLNSVEGEFTNINITKQGYSLNNFSKDKCCDEEIDYKKNNSLQRGLAIIEWLKENMGNCIVFSSTIEEKAKEIKHLIRWIESYTDYSIEYSCLVHKGVQQMFFSEHSKKIDFCNYTYSTDNMKQFKYEDFIFID